MDFDHTGPPPPGVIFDEAWYLTEYPAVADVVRSGGFWSGWEHYVLHGRDEGRHPAPLSRLAEEMEAGAPPPVQLPGRPPFWEHNGIGFLSPADLVVTALEARRIALISSGAFDALRVYDSARMAGAMELVTADPVSGPPARAADDLRSLDFVIIQIMPRDILRGPALSRLSYDDLEGHRRALYKAQRALESLLNVWMRWNQEHGVLTFVANFMAPQQNPMGRLFPRYDIRNPEYFVSQLNLRLETVTRRRKNVFMLDLDRLSSSIGRRFTQDDTLNPFDHGSTMPPDFPEPGWIGLIAPLSEHYDLKSKRQFPDLVWSELNAMFRAAVLADPVRLVVVEPVDTLWKTGNGSDPDRARSPTGGWPEGVAEALLFLRKRGLDVAILSQNDEAVTREIWPDIFDGGPEIGDFSAVKIGWGPKPELMRELMDERRVASGAILYIDADPAERAAMRAVFPDMRILGGLPYYLRRVLLGAAELQTRPAHEGWGDWALDLLPVHPADHPAVRHDATLGSARRRLEALWARAMDNAITSEEAVEIRRLSMAIAVTDRGARRVRPYPNWATR